MKSSMAAAGSEQKELLALMHQHLVQIGYQKAAKELLRQSGQKNFPSPSIPLEDIFTQWKKGSFRAQKRKADDIKTDTAAKIRVPDPKSSSETSEEEEEANPIKTNLPVNNSSSAKVESSSEDEDSSSEEEEVASKMVKATVTGNQTANLLQLAAQKANSVPGKGVAVAAVQAKEKPNKAISNKPSPLARAKAGQNKVPSGKPGAALPSQLLPGLSTASAGLAQKAADSESSSSTSESEEEKKSTAVKMPTPKPPLKKAESSSEDSSEESDSEEPTNTTKVQVKPAVQSAPTSATPVKSLSTPVIPSKESTVKASPAKAKVTQIRAALGNATESKKPADSSDTSDSSDSEDEESSSVAQAKSSEKTPQAFTTSVKNASPNLLSDKAASAPTLLKQIPKPSVSSLIKPALLPLAKVAGSAGSSESSESSSESENEAPPVPVSQKRLQTPQPPTGVKQNQAAKPGTPPKAPSSALKRKETESESSSSSDSEDETVPAVQNLASPSGTKTNAAAQLSHAKKPFSPPASLKAAQQSEDSSQDSSDESDTEEDTVFTQKSSPVTQKALLTPVRTLVAKTTGATLGKAGSAQSAGKGKANLDNLATASLQKASQSSETDSSDSSENEEDGKPAAQPPIHPFFKQKIPSKKAATPSGKDVQVSTATDSISSKCQGKTLATTQRKVELSSSKNAKPCQSETLPAKPAGILKHKEKSRSSSSSDSEEEAVAPLATSTQISQPGTSQKQGVTKKADSSSEESSDGEQEPSQSLLAGYPGIFKTPAAPVQKSVAPKPSKRGSRKTASTTGTPAINALEKPSEKMGPADITSSDSSDTDSDAEEKPAGLKAELGVLPFSAKKAVVAKKSKSGPDSVSKASPAKKATAKSQRNGRAKGNAAIQLPLVPCSESGDNKAVAQDPGAGAQGDTQATPVVTVKTPKTVKPSKAGVKEKQKKKRKLAAGDASLGEPKRKKQKGQTGSEMVKKKKKSKSSSSTKAPKEKDGKEKKPKKSKSKMSTSSTSDVSPLKKKKKKTSDLEGAV
ncbi:treacle protein isoform X2 [Eublepharis macularius]|uniref:Treacle protein isoform X2 n=1 Tax=Eublepharis macularius TaxID=481883 RepID=A0AA97JBG9_EUBMA|nr:treacle protein isoform X2 [Eublepharis macularius]